jgi:hypothetical protein
MRAIYILCIAYFLTVCTGCSVGMAMSGKKSPNLGLIQEGASRGQIELQLGPPIKTASLDNGKRMDIYEYETGNEPSPARAFGHLVMDILTFGLWEILGTPLEGFTGDKYQLTVMYNKRDRVASINQHEKIVEPTETAQIAKVSPKNLIEEAEENSETFDGNQVEQVKAPTQEIIQPTLKTATVHSQKKPEIQKISTLAKLSTGESKIIRDKQECRTIAKNHETEPYKKAFLSCMKIHGWVQKK